MSAEEPQKALDKLLEGFVDEDPTLAYDGSNEPQKRLLTARERDILCRLISDDLSAIRRDGSRYMGRTSSEEIPILQAIYEAINPRTDW